MYNLCVLYVFPLYVCRPLACVSDRSRLSSGSDEHIVQMHKTESINSQQRAQKLRFVSSVEYRHSSGKTAYIYFTVYVCI